MRFINDRIYAWLDKRGTIPDWVWWFYPHAHWCCEMDSLLILDRRDLRFNCYCEIGLEYRTKHGYTQ